MTSDPNDPNRPFEFPSLEQSGRPMDPYPPLDYPNTNPSGAPGYGQYPPPYPGYVANPYQGYSAGAYPAYPQPQYSGYPSPYPGYDPYNPYGTTKPGNSGLATAAFVSSLVGLVMCCLWVPSIAGVVLGIVALNDIKKTGKDGRGMALAGIIIGAVGLVLGIVVIVIGALAPDDTSSTNSTYDPYA
jgi:hypothetical protein